MHASSRQALAELRERLGSVTGSVASADQLTGLARELYEVVDLLMTQPQLRRKLADPSTHAIRRAGLADSLLDRRLAASTMRVVRDAVSLRWSSPWDLLDALEITADEVLFAAGEQGGVLDEVEDELFRFGRVLDADSRLSTLLDDYSAESSRRVELVRRLLAQKVDPITTLLLEHAVASQRKRSITHAIDDLLQLADTRRNRSMARVISAVGLNAAQEARLAAVLTQMYGRPITIRTAVEPSVKGGLVIRVGDEVIDGSVSARLAEVRTALTG